MREFFEKMKKGSVLGFVLCILFGVIICIWPGAVLSIICRVAGAVILAFGIYSLVLCSKKEDTAVQTFQLVAGIVMCVLGVWILFVPGTFLRLIPVVIGIILIYHGIKHILLTSQTNKETAGSWTAGFILAVIAIVLGIVMIFGAGFFLRLGMIFVGVVLIYDGIAGLYMTGHMNRVFKDQKKEDDVIDVDYKEM